MRVRGPLIAAAVAFAAGCAGGGQAAPDCEPDTRLAIVAQSVPGAAYVPCIAELPPGWSFVELDVRDDGTTMVLKSDRADREVEVRLVRTCDVSEATPVTPRDEGSRTYQLIRSISPRYAASLVDVFPGGCVLVSYDFERGPHVASITELQRTVALYPRRDLRQQLRSTLGVTLDP